MEIREFVKSDRDAVLELWDHCGLIVPHNDPGSDIDRKVAVGTELFLVGIREGQLVATVMGGYDGHRGWAYYLAVKRSLRMNGLGRQIIEALEDKLRGLGCPKLNLQVRTTNAETLRFYQALGFIEDDVVSLGQRLG